jgi:hypothetical protein
MGVSFESVRSRALPRDLALRLAIGRAIEALAIYLATEEMTSVGLDAVKRLAEMLTVEAEPLRAGRSIGDYGREAPLILAASQVIEAGRMEDLITSLNEASVALSQIAIQGGAPRAEVDALIKMLVSLRRVIAVSRTTVSEKRPRRPS